MSRFGRKAGLGRRAAVAVWIAVMAPGLIMATAMAVEAGSWAAAQTSVQRAADLSAVAGAIDYLAAGKAQTAATFAARIAQLNGASGTTTPSWNSTTNTLTDNMITAQVVTGYQTGSDTALKVTVQRSLPATMSRAFTGYATYTVTGSGVAELVTKTTGSGGQPCLLALSTSGTVSGSGSTYWTMPNCTVRSNGTVDVHGGGGPLTTGGIYAGGAVNIDTWITTTGGQYPNSGTIPDPYAGNTALQTALSNAAALTGKTTITCSNVSCNGLSNSSTCAYANSVVTCTLYPGNYGGLTLSGGGPYVFNFQPGLFSFQGAVSVSGATTTFNGSAVTIIAAGSFSFQSQPTLNITAPTVSQAASTGGIAAIALATLSTTQVVLSGAATYNLDGVSYFPNAVFNASGANSSTSSSPAQGSASTTCLEIIASSIELNGYSYYNSSCSSLGATAFFSISSTSTTAQVVH